VALRGEDPNPLVDEMISDAVDYLLEKHKTGEAASAEINFDALADDLMRTFLVDMSGDDAWRAMHEDSLRPLLMDKVDAARKLRVSLLGEDLFKGLQRFAILRVIDTKWRDHLYAMDGLKEGVGLRAFGQKDPLIEYKKEGFNLFQQMLDEVGEEALRLIFRAQPVSEGQTAPPPPLRTTRTPAMSYSHADSAGLAYAQATQGPRPDGDGIPPQAERAGPAGKPQPIHVEPTVGRNDACPCGSGKKYKKCHGAGMADAR
jgi:preprotein translocase subunit SecA